MEAAYSQANGKAEHIQEYSHARVNPRPLF